jgi:hypothetical protein
MVSNKTITVLGTVAVVIATSALVLSIGPLRAMALPVIRTHLMKQEIHILMENRRQVVHPWAAPETHMVKSV